MDTCISIENLEKEYITARREVVHALTDINFTIDKGEFVCVVGPSGCGKSTLLKILGGLLPFTSGKVLLMGNSITGPRNDVGIVFQDPVLLPWRSVLENTLLPSEIMGLEPKAARARAHKLHRKHMYQKFDISSQSELFHLFIDSLSCFNPGEDKDPLQSYMHLAG